MHLMQRASLHVCWGTTNKKLIAGTGNLLVPGAHASDFPPPIKCTTNQHNACLKKNIKRYTLPLIATHWIFHYSLPLRCILQLLTVAHLLLFTIGPHLHTLESIMWDSYPSMLTDIIKELSSRYIFHHHEEVCGSTDHLIPA